MLFTWLITGFIVGTLFATFFDEIMNWAKGVFNSLSNSVKKAWVYIRRVPGAIVQMIRYILYGEVIEEKTKRALSWEEIVEMHERGDMDDDTFYALKAEHEKKIAEMDRNR